MVQMKSASKEHRIQEQRVRSENLKEDKISFKFEMRGLGLSESSRKPR